MVGTCIAVNTDKQITSVCAQTSLINSQRRILSRPGLDYNKTICLKILCEVIMKFPGKVGFIIAFYNRTLIIDTDVTCIKTYNTIRTCQRDMTRHIGINTVYGTRSSSALCNQNNLYGFKALGSSHSS